jgi:hypothetical protein
MKRVRLIVYVDDVVHTDHTFEIPDDVVDLAIQHAYIQLDDPPDPEDE